MQFKNLIIALKVSSIAKLKVRSIISENGADKVGLNTGEGSLRFGNPVWVVNACCSRL
ncbi:hypothetical protein N481_22230 [Pseudoalteromonas luteoviolacea S4047-1]|uniref:Uncharacterized protein n=1 Tax=Pseudoalteromonas luteoviolacea S4054 TaxID=1129367 RepID=A0A0F6AGJ3_9GAMM|nr:hypothetical protein N479_08810 [Pseudoalteromonas luteoviolacea S4054]KZN69512.1 hypothetical protein N481_22230 [Pseudoalteromonas luteoviolacea S4047-1]